MIEFRGFLLAQSLIGFPILGLDRTELLQVVICFLNFRYNQAFLTTLTHCGVALAARKTV